MRTGSGVGWRTSTSSWSARKDTTLPNYYSSCVRHLQERVADFIESELITGKGFRNSYAREDAVPSRLSEDELSQLIRLTAASDRGPLRRATYRTDPRRTNARRTRASRPAARQKRRKEKEKAALEAEKQATNCNAPNCAEQTPSLPPPAPGRRDRRPRAAKTVIAVAAGSSRIHTQNDKKRRDQCRAATAQKLIAQAQGMLAGTTPAGTCALSSRSWPPAR